MVTTRVGGLILIKSIGNQASSSTLLSQNRRHLWGKRKQCIAIPIANAPVFVPCLISFPINPNCNAFVDVQTQRLSAGVAVTETARTLSDLLLLDGDNVDGDGVELEVMLDNVERDRRSR